MRLSRPSASYSIALAAVLSTLVLPVCCESSNFLSILFKHRNIAQNQDIFWTSDPSQVATVDASNFSKPKQASNFSKPKQYVRRNIATKKSNKGQNKKNRKNLSATAEQEGREGVVTMTRDGDYQYLPDEDPSGEDRYADGYGDSQMLIYDPDAPPPSNPPTGTIVKASYQIQNNDPCATHLHEHYKHPNSRHQHLDHTHFSADCGDENNSPEAAPTYQDTYLRGEDNQDNSDVGNRTGNGGYHSDLDMSGLN